MWFFHTAPWAQRQSKLEGEQSTSFTIAHWCIARERTPHPCNSSRTHEVPVIGITDRIGNISVYKNKSDRKKYETKVTTSQLNITQLGLFSTKTPNPPTKYHWFLKSGSLNAKSPSSGRCRTSSLFCLCSTLCCSTQVTLGSFRMELASNSSPSQNYFSEFTKIFFVTNLWQSINHGKFCDLEESAKI